MIADDLHSRSRVTSIIFTSSNVSSAGLPDVETVSSTQIFFRS